MRVTRIPAHEIDESLTRHWHALQAHPDHPEWLHPFLSPEFAKLTGEVLPRSRVAVIEDAGTIVGVWTYEAFPGGLARPLARHMSDLQGLLIAPGPEHLLPWIARQCGLRLLRFDHLLPSEALIRAAMTSEPSSSSDSLAMTVSLRSGWMIDLSEGFEAYRMAQSRQTRWWRRAPGKARRLAEALGPLSWQDEVQDDAAWLMLARWKSAQYRQSGLRDNFAIGWVRQWLERLRWSDTPALKGSLQSLRADGNLVAVHFGVRGHKVLHHYLPAYARQIGIHSPGSVLLEQTIRHAVNQGLNLIDMSTGDLDYKSAVCNRRRALAIGVLGPGWLIHAVRQARAIEHRLRHWPGLLPVARQGKRALVRVINGPAQSVSARRARPIARDAQRASP
ncbi:MAG: GNAT family N-acetyltransferase [Burkholderiaceae bacterium]